MTRIATRLPDHAIPAVALAAVTATALLAAPAIAGQLGRQFGLASTQIGLYFTIEQGGMCLATIPSIWWLNRVNWRRVATVAMGAFIIANLLSTQIADFRWLLLARAASSLSGGTLMVLSMTLAGRSAERERLFALWTLGQLTIGAILLALLPRAFEAFGLAFLYALLAGLMTASLFLLRQIPGAVAAPSASSLEGGDSARPSRFVLVLGVGGVLLYYLGYGGFWPFLAATATPATGAPLAAGTALALAGCSGIAGALLAAAAARRGGRSVLIAGYLAHAVALMALVDRPGIVRFTIAACLLKGSSTFILPFILGRTAGLDGDGRLMGFTNMAIGGGLAIGPLIGGAVIEGSDGFGALIALTIAWIAASALSILSLGKPRRAAPIVAAEASPTRSRS